MRKMNDNPKLDPREVAPLDTKSDSSICLFLHSGIMLDIGRFFVVLLYSALPLREVVGLTQDFSILFLQIRRP